MEINWTIEQLERQTETGGVIIAHWRVNATDGYRYSAGSYGSAGFTPDPESPDFIPFDQLTESDVLNWLWEKEGFDKNEIENRLQSQIDAQKNPVTITGLPWPTGPEFEEFEETSE